MRRAVLVQEPELLEHQRASVRSKLQSGAAADNPRAHDDRVKSAHAGAYVKPASPKLAGEPYMLRYVQVRRILHIDADAFFAAIEQRDNPSLLGRPIAVGSDSPRGVVATASYEARRFGVGSAMPSRMALERCPDLIFVKPRFSVYSDVGRQLREIYARHAPLVEPVSIDEAYLDVTEPLQGPPSGTLTARRIRQDVL